MKEIFSKTDFPTAPGGNIYPWTEADTTFTVPESGKYVIAITASVKNAAQNGSSDDDDLRVKIDDFEFGQYEIHDEKVSWKGFGTASSWDGASLKGGTKTIYFFMELSDNFYHKIKFYADEKPEIKEIKVYQINDLEFSLSGICPPENIETNRKGIPWMSFVFIGARPKNFELNASLRAASHQETDGDNLKIVINGKIFPNEKAPTSDKYKNFYFSGDLLKDEIGHLLLQEDDFQYHENSFEIWYDGTPEIKDLKIVLDKTASERRESIIKDMPLKIVIAENPDLDDSEKWYEMDIFEDVSDHQEVYEKYANQYEIDPDFVKAIAYLETTHGYYDILYSVFNQNSSILPMNINPSLWGEMEEDGNSLGYGREDLEDADKNIKLGVLLLKRIWDRVENPTVEKVATLYQNLNAFKVSDYGARVKKIYEEKLFEK